jgi:hypothetical protein
MPHAILEILRTQIGTAALSAMVGGMVGLGLFELKARRMPSWMKGWLAWPLGAVITDRIVLMQGSAAINLGLSLAVLTLQLHFGQGSIHVVLLAVTAALWILGTTYWGWSAILSHRPERLAA